MEYTNKASHFKPFLIVFIHNKKKMADALASKLVETLADVIKDEVSMLFGVKDDLQQLKNKVRMIRDVLNDAERKAFTKPSVCDWLANLKDIIYDADDTIDHYQTNTQKFARLSSEQSSLPVLVRCSSPFQSCIQRLIFSHQTGSRIRSINSRLERVFKDISELNLIADTRDDRGSSDRIIPQRETTPGLETIIVGLGIHLATEQLVHLFTTLDGQPISIIATVGMGGIGKTTLAQNIYNHHAIKSHFNKPLPMWMSVTRDYNEVSLLKEIIRWAGGQTGDAQSLGELETKLIDLVKNKKLFLVLDDVWDAQVWENLLRKPLSTSARGSWILITTRDENVAEQMGAIHRHKVQLLAREDGWSLLCSLVFQEGTEGLENVREVGMQIVEKCEGLPLALRTVAGVLRSKEKSRRGWSKVLEDLSRSLTNHPEGVMGVLYLSYEDLPLHLKQCFLYLSLFPEGFQYNKDRLTTEWAAEGFIMDEENVLMEDVAETYCDELVSRNILQKSMPRVNLEQASVISMLFPLLGSSYEFYYKMTKYYTMHSLHQSLARFLAQDENLVGDVMRLVKFTPSSFTKPRRLFVSDTGLSSVPDAVMKGKKSVRTLFFQDLSLVRDIQQDLFKKLSSLRILDLSGSGIAIVPESLGYLIHLRYLNLCRCLLIEELPETIANLTNLQFLFLNSCKNLKKLPKGIGRLHNMRCLQIVDTAVRGMPTGMGKLQHLNQLLGFVANERSDGGDNRSQEHELQDRWCSLEELSSLSQLRDLRLVNLEKALMSVNDRPRRFLLKDKIHLRTLFLSMRAYGNPHIEDSERLLMIFENELCPPPYIENCCINGYFGLRYPSWMQPSNINIYLGNLKMMGLQDWSNCTHLPPLGLLPNLEVLEISSFDSVREIGPEFMGLGNQGMVPKTPHVIPFPRLKILSVRQMPNLVTWNWEIATEDEGGLSMAMHRLTHLAFVDCPQLQMLPRGLRQLTALQFLHIEQVSSLMSVEDFPNFNCVLNLVRNPNLWRVSNLSSARVLLIKGCSALRAVDGLQSLQLIQIEDLEMDCLPEWLLLKGIDGCSPFPMLQCLYIYVRDVAALCRYLRGGPCWPMIQHFPCFVSIAIQGRPEHINYLNGNPPIYQANLDDGETADHAGESSANKIAESS